MLKLSTLESKGLATEIAGLLMLLLATVWQVAFTDWLDTFPARSQYYIQETANLAILQALGKTAEAIRDESPDIRRKLLDEADTISTKAMFDLVGIRASVDEVAKNQSAPFRTVRYVLFVLGAILIVIGKVLVLIHKDAQGKADPSNAA